MTILARGTGRRAHFDPRNLDYLWRDVAAPRTMGGSLVEEAPYKYHNDSGWWGDQKRTQWCVSYAWLHDLADGPVTQPRRPLEEPDVFFRRIHAIDVREGRNWAEGASTLAGVKAARELGAIGEFRWSYDVSEIAQTVYRLKPVVVGTAWPDEMFEPDAQGVLRVKNYIAGDSGHEYVLNGVHLTRAMFRLKQSWGRSWANKGHAWLPFETLARLMPMDGECCITRELRAA